MLPHVSSEFTGSIGGFFDGERNGVTGLVETQCYMYT